MTKDELIDELIDEIAMFIDLGKMLGEDTHIIAESIYERYIKKKEGEDEVLPNDDE